MAINKISNTTRGLIREQSVLSIPDRPTEKGFTAQQLKEYFTNLVLGDQGALTEIDRLVDEINELVGDIGDETIKNYVTNSIISKLIEQSPYIGLSIVNNKLRYTRYGNPNITGELDYIPSDSVFFNGENLIGKNKSVILPKTSIDKLVDKIDDKSVREYILGLNSKINELLEKHNQEIESVNASLEAILGGDAPDALNSIKELAEALKNNPSQVDNLLLQLSNLENNKVDRIDGKQLSTNDYDNESKAFVDSLKIKNLIGEEDLKTDLSQFNDDSEHRLVSDEEKNNWNSKADGNHKHGIEDVNGLSDALNDKSHKDHTHTADEIGAEGKGTTEKLINEHNSSEKSHEDIRLILDLLRNRVDGIHSAISFYDEQQLIDWIDGVYTRNDGFIPDNLFVGQHIYIKNQDENDYWVAVTPVTSLSELLPLPTDKINLEDYAAIEDLKRVAFTGSYKDLSDVPNIPKSLSELSEDDNHKTITKQKLELIDTNAEKLLEKLDTNLGIDEANKMLITDAEGKITTAVAGSMSVLVDNLTSSSTTMPLTANQGRVLNNIKLDKQQGVENANKYLYINSLGLIDLSNIKTKLSEFENDKEYQTLEQVQTMINAIPTPDVSGQIENHNTDEDAHSNLFENYLPLTAGSDKKLTGDLYATKDIILSHSKALRGKDTSGNTNRLLEVSTTNNVWINYDNLGKTIVGGTAIQPFSANHHTTDLGIETAAFRNIHGKTIYQNGKQVANKEDISGLASETFVNTKISELINGAPTTLDTLKEIADAMSANQSVVEALEKSIGNKANSSDLANYIPQGGTLSKPLTVTGGDSATAGKIILTENGQITDAGTATLFGRSGGNLIVGHSSIPTTIRGKATRPTYNSTDIALYSDIPDTSSLVPNTRTVNGKTLSTNISLGSSDVGALPNFTLNIGSTNGGNPRQVKFLSVNYSSNATYFKMGATSCHDNGTSYQFLEDIIIGVTTSGTVVCNVYKYCQQEVTLDNVTRNYGDVFYIIDTTNKIVDFYILLGQYSSAQFTPATKIGNTTIQYVTQYSGSPTYYSSGTKVWANGNGATYAKTSDLTNYLSLSNGGTVSGAVAFTGTVGNTQSSAGIYLGLDTNTTAPNANMAIASANSAAYIDMGRPNVDYDFRIIKWNGVSDNVAQLVYGGNASGTITIPKATGTMALTSDLNTRLALDGSNTMTGKLNLKATGNSEGNIGVNGIRWNSDSLPEDTAPQYFCTIDGFANGGRQKWASLANVKSKLGLGTQVTFSLSGTTLTITPK